MVFFSIGDIYSILCHIIEYVAEECTAWIKNCIYSSQSIVRVSNQGKLNGGHLALTGRKGYARTLVMGKPGRRRQSADKLK